MLLVMFIALHKLRTQETFTISVVPVNAMFPVTHAHPTLSLPVSLSHQPCEASCFNSRKTAFDTEVALACS